MRIVVITDPWSNFAGGGYYLSRILADHDVTVCTDLGALPDADLAILHVDLSVVPQVYVDTCRKYARVVNGRALDIRKRVVSRNLVTLGDGFDGPVIVKTDLNCGGIPEAHAGQSVGLAATDKPYPIYRRAQDVPGWAWTMRGVVVERFLPEHDERGFWTRSWTFCGSRGMATRYLSAQPIVKSSGILASEPCDVPDEIRAERERLGVDFGKFDFVVHQGRPVLLDANKTPAAPPAGFQNDELALGLLDV